MKGRRIVVPRIREFCPECEPDIDPRRTDVEAKLCKKHRPTTEGSDDGRVRLSISTGLTTEALGSDCRNFAVALAEISESRKRTTQSKKA